MRIHHADWSNAELFQCTPAPHWCSKSKLSRELGAVARIYFMHAPYLRMAHNVLTGTPLLLLSRPRAQGR